VYLKGLLHILFIVIRFGDIGHTKGKVPMIQFNPDFFQKLFVYIHNDGSVSKLVEGLKIVSIFGFNESRRNT